MLDVEEVSRGSCQKNDERKGPCFSVGLCSISLTHGMSYSYGYRDVIALPKIIILEKLSVQ